MHVSEIRKRRGGSARTNIIIQSYMSFLKTIMFMLMFLCDLCSHTFIRKARDFREKKMCTNSAYHATIYVAIYCCLNKNETKEMNIKKHIDIQPLLVHVESAQSVRCHLRLRILPFAASLPWYRKTACTVWAYSCGAGWSWPNNCRQSKMATSAQWNY